MRSSSVETRFLPAFFGEIEDFVGAAEGQGDLNGFGFVLDRDRKLEDGIRQPLDLLFSFFQGIGLEEEDELVASITGQEITAPEVIAGALGHRLQGFVPDGVSEAVVDELEIVNVENDQKEGVGQDSVPIHKPLQLPIECAAVIKPRERVPERLLGDGLQLILQDIPPLDELGHAGGTVLFLLPNGVLDDPHLVADGLADRPEVFQDADVRKAV